MMLADRTCVLDMPEVLESIGRSMIEADPAVGESYVRCPFHGEYHYYNPHDLVLRSPEESVLPLPPKGGQRKGSKAKLRRWPRIPANAGPNYCRWHGTFSKQIPGACPWCKAALHVHKDQLGVVKLPGTGQGYLAVRCPQCHRYLGVQVVHLKGKKDKDAIKTVKLEDGEPVGQPRMRGIG